MNFLPISSKKTALLLAGFLMTGASYAQISAPHGRSFNGTWAGGFTTVAITKLGIQGCKFDVTKAVIDVNKKSIDWTIKRTKCIQQGCHSCPEYEESLNRIAIHGNDITFSSHYDPAGHTKPPLKDNQYLVTGILDLSGSHIVGAGNMKSHNTRYALTLHRVSK